MNPRPKDGGPDPEQRRRYYEVNFRSCEQHGTVEFRQHEGTMDPNVVITWVEFVLALVQTTLCKSEAGVRQLQPTVQALMTLVGDAKYQAMANQR